MALRLICLRISVTPWDKPDCVTQNLSDRYGIHLETEGPDRLLTNLFRLDGTPKILEQGVTPQMSPGETVENTVFAPGAWEPQTRMIKGVKFKNVAFSKTKISQITFTDCTFEDCLFTGAQFDEVEFHGCKILNCTLWKVRMSRVYLKPEDVFFAPRFRVEAANVGISAYQSMLSNFAEERQDIFYMQADINFRRWKRYQIWHDLRTEKKTRRQAYWDWLCSVTHETLTGFGYRPVRFLFWTLVLFFAISGLNYFLIGDAISVANPSIDSTTASTTVAPAVNSPVRASFVNTVFFTFSVLTVLGFSTVTPLSSFAKLLSVVEALAAIGWLGIFTAVLVKRFLR